jgi:hypothetical protein
MAEENKKSDSMPKDLMGILGYYLVKKTPFQIPDNAKEWIVKFVPWITTVLLIVGFIGFIPYPVGVLGLMGLYTGWANIVLYGYGYGLTGFWFIFIVLILQMGLEVAALPGLFARKISGWTLLFYSQVVSIVYSLVSGDIFGAIVSALVGFYVLFQIREKYVK